MTEFEQGRVAAESTLRSVWKSFESCPSIVELVREVERFFTLQKKKVIDALQIPNEIDWRPKPAHSYRPDTEYWSGYADYLEEQYEKFNSRLLVGETTWI